MTFEESVPLYGKYPPVKFDGAPPTHEPFHAAIDPLAAVIPVTAERYEQRLPSKFKATQVDCKSQVASQSSKVESALSCLFC